jgi:cell division protein ZapA (FtsZ GTPase activity inhibitor)
MNTRDIVDRLNTKKVNEELRTHSITFKATDTEYKELRKYFGTFSNMRAFVLDSLEILKEYESMKYKGTKYDKDTEQTDK